MFFHTYEVLKSQLKLCKNGENSGFIMCTGLIHMYERETVTCLIHWPREHWTVPLSAYITVSSFGCKCIFKCICSLSIYLAEVFEESFWIRDHLLFTLSGAACALQVVSATRVWRRLTQNPVSRSRAQYEPRNVSKMRVNKCSHCKLMILCTCCLSPMRIERLSGWKRSKDPSCPLWTLSCYLCAVRRRQTLGACPSHPVANDGYCNLPL